MSDALNRDEITMFNFHLKKSREITCGKNKRRCFGFKKFSLLRTIAGSINCPRLGHPSCLPSAYCTAIARLRSSRREQLKRSSTNRTLSVEILYINKRPLWQLESILAQPLKVPPKQNDAFEFSHAITQITMTGQLTSNVHHYSQISSMELE